MNRIEEQRAHRLREGHIRFGWPEDATCEYCGDTGYWPLTGTFHPCEAGHRVREAEARERLVESAHQRWMDTGVPSRFQRYRLDTSPDQSSADAVRPWVDDRRWTTGTNLILRGPTGVGKTGIAIGCLYEAVANNRTGAFWSVPYLLDLLRPESTIDPMPSCLSANVLVLDDFGAERPSTWTVERLYVIVNNRYEQQQSTIITMNNTLPGLREHYGDRIVSRLLEEAIVVEMNGPDRRLI